MKFSEFNLSTSLFNALDDLQLEEATPIQEAVFAKVMSGKDVMGIAQTGTGKTFAYILPILRQLKFSKQKDPRVLVLVPTRELVTQVVEDFKSLSTYMNLRIAGVYGGVSMNTQAAMLAEGLDVLVATPGRLMDHGLNRNVKLKSIQKLVIDEVDEMFNLGFRVQLNNIFDLLSPNRQNLMFSATMSEEIESLLKNFFKEPEKVEVENSGNAHPNIEQSAFSIINFNTKVNMLVHLLKDTEDLKRALIFVGSKKLADRLGVELDRKFPHAFGVIHSNKSQNYRLGAVEDFQKGDLRGLIATDLVARGIDFSEVSAVINFDIPEEPESYVHRIGRTGRAGHKGKSITFVTEKEELLFENVERRLGMSIELQEMPQNVNIVHALIPEEMEKDKFDGSSTRIKKKEGGEAFHEKSEKNSKINLGGPTKRKPPKTKPVNRGNLRRKKR